MNMRIDIYDAYGYGKNKKKMWCRGNQGSHWFLSWLPLDGEQKYITQEYITENQ